MPDKGNFEAVIVPNIVSQETLGDTHPCITKQFSEQTGQDNGQPASLIMMTTDEKEPDSASFTLGGFADYKEGVGTLKKTGGDLGGGQRISDNSEEIGDIKPYSETVGCLQARDYKGVGNQYVQEDKLIIHESKKGNSI